MMLTPAGIKILDDAMRETARERKAGSKNGEADVLAKIAEMPNPIAPRPSAFTQS